MNHIDVLWKSGNPIDPYRLVSELDEQRFETRKLEFFRSGAVGSASAVHETEGTSLGTAAVPSLDEINLDPQFEGSDIGPNEFEQLWAQYGRSIQEHEVVELLALGEGIPQNLPATQAAVLHAYECGQRWAYEVEFVAPDGSTRWLGTLARELLRATAR